jgi:homoserine kinase
VKTTEARRLLPDTMSRADAVFNLQRVALLLQALTAGRPELLREALKDRWHQPYRADLVPGLAEALALDHPDLLGVCLSGSGPTVVGLVGGDTAGIEEAFGGIYDRLGVPSRIRVLTAHNQLGSE